MNEALVEGLPGDATAKTANRSSEEQASPDEQQSMIDATKINVIFSRRQLETLQRLAAMQGISLSDALRQAIDLSEIIVKASVEKKQILLKQGEYVQELKIAR